MVIKSKAIFYLIFFLAFIIGTFTGLRLFWQNDQKKIIINNQVIFVEIAQTKKSLAKGLSDREKLPQNRGMLFLLTPNDSRLFWMNQMKFGLDFVFIKDDKVVDLAENIPFPKDQEIPRTVTSKNDFNKVLEVNSGMIEKLNIKIGDQVNYKDQDLD